MQKKQLYILFGILAGITILSRIIPHWENFAPLGAFALFAGALFPGRWRAIIPVLGAMLLSDVLLHFVKGYPIFHSTTLWVYGGFTLIVLMGWLLRGKRNVPAALATAVVGSLAFFLVTNIGSWVMSPVGTTPPFSYPADFAGMLTALEMGWPFYRMTLAADVFYTAVFFGGWAWFSRSQSRLASTAAHEA